MDKFWNWAVPNHLIFLPIGIASFILGAYLNGSIFADTFWGDVFSISAVLFIIPSLTLWIGEYQKSHPKSGITFTCPQATLVYRPTNILTALAREEIEKKLTRLFAANPDIKPRNYEDALHITIVHFDRKKPPTPSSSPISDDIDAGDIH